MGIHIHDGFQYAFISKLSVKENLQQLLKLNLQNNGI